MSYITISKAAEILGVNKKTLFRWDSEDRFKPAKREEVSRNRLYDEDEVRRLKLVIERENRYQKNAKELHEVINQLGQSVHIKNLLLSENEIKLDEKREELYSEHKDLVKEFNAFPYEIKLLHARFYKILS